MNINEIKCGECGRVAEWPNVKWNNDQENIQQVYFSCKCGNVDENKNLILIVEKWLDIKNDKIKLKDFIENVLCEEYLEDGKGEIVYFGKPPMTINEIGEQGYKHAERNGFYKDSPRYEIHKKLREENSEFIDSHSSDIGIFNEVMAAEKENIDIGKIDWCKMFEAKIKNSEGDELADIIITAAAGARKMGIDIESHIIAKMRYNSLREDHR
jgi:hypothetical protein